MPITTLTPGIPAKSLNAVAAATTGTVFALQQRSGNTNQARSVSWRTAIGGTAAAVDADLQGAMNDVEAEYADIDTSTHVTGEYRTISGVLVRFLRVKLNTLTAGASPTFTAELLI